MIKNKKNYFSFFGILLATVNRKMLSRISIIASIISLELPKITKLLLAKQLKPIKQYSTNSI
ncbi:hypothetical protein [Arcobacter sp. LA11]|uniref:hypothetical protein n=1 Tax=Arcobacter sp. LA11 TaxID=1898176 RepID=UPI000933A4AE|nr:hypothetical protein [Arcobacter sp. LA11]